MDRTRKFFKDVIFYSGSNFFSNILNFITAVVIRKILQPAFMGLYNEIMLIFDYAQHSHLGIINSLDKELPYLYGKKDNKGAEETRNIGFTVCLAVATSIVMALLIASMFLKFSEDKLLINGIRVVTLLILLRLGNSLYIVLNRSRHNFLVITKYTILIAILDICFKITLIIKFGLYGLLWASVLTALLGLIYFYKASREKFRLVFRFPLSKIAHLLKIGFPIFVTGFTFMTLRNIDRIMIIRFLGRESLGYYTIGLMVSVYMVQLPNLVYAVIFPRFYEAYGEKQNILGIKDHFIKPTIVFAYLFPILIGLVIIILPLLVYYILPSYAPGLFPAYLLLLGCSFLSLVNMPGYLLIALNKQTRIVFIGVFSVFLAAMSIYLFIKRFNLGLSGVAIGASLGYLSYATILMAYAFRNYTKKYLSHLKFFAELYFPFIWVVIVLLLLRVFSFKTRGIFLKDFSIILYKGIIFLVSSIPLILYANKKTGILTILKRTYLRRGNV